MNKIAYTKHGEASGIPCRDGEDDSEYAYDVIEYGEHLSRLQGYEINVSFLTILRSCQRRNIQYEDDNNHMSDDEILHYATIEICYKRLVGNAMRIQTGFANWSEDQFNSYLLITVISSQVRSIRII